MMRNLSILLVFLSLLISNSLYAATYKWTDDNGNVVYSQHPPESGQYDLMKGLKHSRSSGVTNSETPSQSESSENSENGGGNQELSEEDQKLKKQNCEAAQKNLDVYKVYKRVKGSDGKVTTLSDEERQKRIEEAQNQVNLFCN